MTTSTPASAPTISIVLPTWNRAHLVGRAIGSVLNQTFKDWELIVVDDGSTDDTAQIVQSCRGGRIRYIQRDRNYGLQAARNTGIRAAAASQFIAFLDDDDEWLPAKLEKQLAVFRNGGPTLAVVGCGRLTYSRRSISKVLPQCRGWIFEDLLAGRATGCGTPLLLVKRFPGEPDTFFDEEFPALGERDYLMRIARHHTIDFVMEPLIKVYRNDGGPHVANPRNAARAYAVFLRKYASDIEARPGLKRFFYMCMAKELAETGQLGEARRQISAALKFDRRDPKPYVWFAASFLGRHAMRACGRIFRNKPPRISHACEPMLMART
jgi:glycosyltransferase involved in cell wall biosynthesis